MSASPDFTLAQIKAQSLLLSCCLGQGVQSLVSDEWKGVEACECEWDRLDIVLGAKEVLDSYIPPDTIVNQSVRAIAPMAVPYNLAGVTLITVKIGSTTIYSHAGSIAGTRLMIADIVSTVSSPYVASSDVADHLTISSPTTGYYNGSVVTLSYFDNFLSVTVTQTAIMSNGQYLQTEEMNCLTNAQVQDIIETSSQICGCLSCSPITDS